MQLYSSAISPFAARVRIALQHKGLPCTLVAPPTGGLKGPQYLALNPIGKLPVLVLDDGSSIVESETILDFLEDTYPDQSLRPNEPLQRARMRTLVRVTDNYVTPPTIRLFPHLNPATREPHVVEREISLLRTGLGYLEQFVEGPTYAYGSRLTLADCCVFPSLHLCRIVTSQLGITELFDSLPRLSRYFEGARQDETLARVYDEVESALAAYATA